MALDCFDREINLGDIVLADAYGSPIFKKCKVIEIIDGELSLEYINFKGVSVLFSKPSNQTTKVN